MSAATFLRLLIGGEVACAGQHVEFAAAGGGAKCLHVRRSDAGSSAPAMASTGTRMVATVGTESGRVARPACTATRASGVSVMLRAHFGDELGSLTADGRCHE